MLFVYGLAFIHSFVRSFIVVNKHYQTSFGVQEALHRSTDSKERFLLLNCIWLTPTPDWPLGWPLGWPSPGLLFVRCKSENKYLFQLLYFVATMFAPFVSVRPSIHCGGRRLIFAQINLCIYFWPSLCQLASRLLIVARVCRLTDWVSENWYRASMAGWWLKI